MRHESSSGLIHVLVSDNSRMHTELLADALTRDGGLQVMTSVSGSADLMGSVSQNQVDVLLLSSNLDERPGRGFEVLRDLRSSSVEVPAVMLLDSSKRESIVEAFRAGARGVFSRHESVHTLSKCVRRVHEGQIWANSHQMAVLVQELASSYEVRAVDAKGMNLLSNRETEIVSCLAQGLTNREIADQLRLSPHTIKNVLFRIFDKLGVSNRVELLCMVLSREHDVQARIAHRPENSGVADSEDGATLRAWQKAADQGDLAAQLALAQFYAARRASRTDTVQAYQWYSIVSEQILRVCQEITDGMGVEETLQAEEAAGIWLNKRGIGTSARRRIPNARRFQHQA